MCIYLPYTPIKYLSYMVYMPNVVDTFVSSTNLVITCEVGIVVGCVLTHVCKNIGSRCPFSMFAVLARFAMGSHICLVLYSKYVNSDTGDGHLVVVPGGQLSTCC